ncbi:Low-temperature-induced 65 kDa protein [Striga hermonthica]|uniref:Low-temperature-induced 65 kDa protein n=1 Tax=Striga hermonthica TaxID=68872 RepID=A0A9N7NNR5_STRHE|nr:Low-temperature-induced 65 kDa protein [Striga hermonthica]
MHGHHHNKEDDLHDTVDGTPVIPGTALPVQTEVNPDKVLTGHEMLTVEDGLESRAGARKPEDENPGKMGTDFVEEVDVAEPTVQISRPTGLEEDPHSIKSHPGKIHPSNYQSKVTDLKGEGGAEAEVAPLVERLDRLHIPAPENESYTGSHGQFAPQPTPTAGEFVPESNPVGSTRDSEELPKSFGRAETESMPRDTITGKSAGCAAAEEGGGGRGVSVKEYLAEKLRPGEEDRALSEAILGKLQGKKAVVGQAAAAEEYVAAGGGGSSGGWVVGRLKRAVGSWIGKGGKHMAGQGKE